MATADEPLTAVPFGNCPLPQSRYDQVLLGHGSGGQLTAELIQRIFVPAFANDVLTALEDQATLALPGAGESRIAFTTDSFVVRPLFFPGGDIGRLAVHGTVNDLAVGGARPLFLSAAFILEEGLPLADLKRIVDSMRRACAEARVTLVTGDTKVVDRGKGDGVFITTSGIGIVPKGRSLSIHNARPGDCILVSGTLGDHGIAIMSVREGLEFETVLESDTAALNGLAEAVLEACPKTRCMRDPTRGGLSSAMNELASASRVGVKLDESADAAAAGSARSLRDAGPRSSLRRQRRQAHRRRAAGGRRPRPGGDAGASAGQERRDHRRRDRRPRRHGDHAFGGGRRAGGDDAVGRAAAPDLLEDEPRPVERAAGHEFRPAAGER